MGELTTIPTYTFSQSINVQFIPLPDITAFELAKLLPFFRGQPMYEADWQQLGEMQRHFTR